MEELSEQLAQTKSALVLIADEKSELSDLLAQTKSDLFTCMNEKNELEQRVSELQSLLDARGPILSDHEMQAEVKRLKKKEEELEEQIAESQRNRKEAERREESTLEMLQQFSGMLGGLKVENDGTDSSDGVQEIGVIKVVEMLTDTKSQMSKLISEKEEAMSAAIHLESELELAQIQISDLKEERDNLLHKVQELTEPPVEVPKFARKFSGIFHSAPAPPPAPAPAPAPSHDDHDDSDIPKFTRKISDRLFHRTTAPAPAPPPAPAPALALAPAPAHEHEESEIPKFTRKISERLFHREPAHPPPTHEETPAPQSHSTSDDDIPKFTRKFSDRIFHRSSVSEVIVASEKTEQPKEEIMTSPMSLATEELVHLPDPDNEELGKTVKALCDARDLLARVQDVNETLQAKVKHYEPLAVRSEALITENVDLTLRVQKLETELVNFRAEDQQTKQAMSRYLEVMLSLSQETAMNATLRKKIEHLEREKEITKQSEHSRHQILQLKLQVQTLENEIATLRARSVVKFSENPTAVSGEEGQGSLSTSPSTAAISFVPYSELVTLEDRLAVTNRTLVDLREAYDKVETEKEALHDSLQKLLQAQKKENEQAMGEVEVEREVMTSSMKNLARKLFSVKKKTTEVAGEVAAQVDVEDAVEAVIDLDDDLFVPEMVGISPKYIPLVTPREAAQILSSLPFRYRFSNLRLSYSTVEHGCSLNTFFNNTAKIGPSIIIIKDSHDKVFGGYASDSWREDSGYYGGGESFVFTIQKPDDLPDTPPEKARRSEVKTYRWSRENDYFIISKRDLVAMGGGGCFAFWISGDLQNGGSGESTTFKNPMLAQSEQFVVNEIQVWSLDHQ